MRTQKQILTAIQHIAITGKGLDQAVQSVGLDVLQHVDQHGEVSLANKLLKALPKGARAKALADWFQRFGKIAVNTDKATAKEFPLVFDKARTTDVEQATTTPWYTCRQDKPLAVEFDFAGQLASLIKRAQAAQAKGLPIKGAEQLAALQIQVPSVPAVPAVPVAPTEEAA